MTFSARHLALSLALPLLLTGCTPNPPAAPIANNYAADPSAANLAPVPQNYAPAARPTRVLGTSSSYNPQQQDEEYGDGNNQPYYQAEDAPPPLPAYNQPPAPGDGYIWTPGYYSHSPQGYNWVPGRWQRPPYTGALYTPGYWHHENDRYAFHPGYWGPHVGYYGGIDYGAGYVGTGYQGGYWNNNRFLLNAVVNNVIPGILSIYRRPVVYDNRTYNNPYSLRTLSYNGPGGVIYDARPYEQLAYTERHTVVDYGPREVYVNRQPHVIVNNGHPNGFIPGSPGHGNVYVNGGSFDKHEAKREEHADKHFEQHFDKHHNGQGGDHGNGKGHGHGKD